MSKLDSDLFLSLFSTGIPTSPNLRSPPLAHEHHASLEVNYNPTRSTSVDLRPGPPLTDATSTFSMDSNAAEQMICESLAPPPPLAHRFVSISSDFESELCYGPKWT